MQPPLHWRISDRGLPGLSGRSDLQESGLSKARRACPKEIAHAKSPGREPAVGRRMNRGWRMNAGYGNGQ